MSGLNRLTAADLAAYAEMLAYMRRDLQTDPELRMLDYHLGMTIEVARSASRRRLGNQLATAAE